MSPSSLRLRIFTAIGASGLAILATEACGATPPTPAPEADASLDSGHATTPDAAEEAAPEAAAEAGADTAAADTATADVAPDRISARRPLLVGTSLRSASPVLREDWLGECGEPAPANLDPGTKAALAQAWGRDGCEEHASIAAFARLTLHLLAVGAPPELIERAHTASLDEIRHARGCFALARRYGGVAVGPGPLALTDLFASTASSPAIALADIAALCAEEGCVGETLGVLLASDALSRTRDPFVRTMLSAVLAEEGEHVDLAWRVVSWCIAQGGDPVRAAVDQAFRRGIAATRAIVLRRYDGIDLVAWNEHGRPTCEQARAVAERGIVEVVSPCARAMLQGTRMQAAPAIEQQPTS